MKFSQDKLQEYETTCGTGQEPYIGMLEVIGFDEYAVVRTYPHPEDQDLSIVVWQYQQTLEPVTADDLPF